MTVPGISVYRGKAMIFRIVESTMGHRDFGWLFLGRLDERVCWLAGGYRGFSTIGHRESAPESASTERGGYKSEFRLLAL